MSSIEGGEDIEVKGRGKRRESKCESIGTPKYKELLKVLYWNMNGYSSSRYLLDHLLEEKVKIDGFVFDFVILSETKLNKASNIEFMNNFPQFTVYSNTYDCNQEAVDTELNDMKNKHGIALLVSKRLTHRIVPIKTSDPHFTAVMLNAGSRFDRKVLVLAVYMPTYSNDQTEFVQVLMRIQGLIEKTNPDQVMGFGDWNVNEASPPQRQMFFQEWLENNMVTINYPDKPTHRLYTTGRESFLDGIILSANTDSILHDNITLNEERLMVPIPSDHNPILAILELDLHDEESRKEIDKIVYPGNRVRIIPEKIEEWNAVIREKMKSIEPYDEYADNMRLRAISDIIMTSSEEVFEQKKRGKKRKGIYGLTRERKLRKELIGVGRKKSRIRNYNARKILTGKQKQIVYQIKEIQRKRKNLEVTFVKNKMKHKELTIYEFINSLKGKMPGLPEVLEIGGTIYRGEEVKEQVVAYFNMMGDPENARYREGFWNDYEEQCKELIEEALEHPDIKRSRVNELTLTELKNIIQSFPNNKAPDVDGVTHDMLKCLNDENLEYILDTMNKIIRHDNFSLPELLKSRFSLLHKGHGKSPLDINNYRRITVSQTIQRLFDRMFNLRGYIDRVSKMIEKSQYGFLKGKSFEMPQLAVRIGMAIALEKGLDLLLASFDAEKFYPSCSPYIIMRENFMNEAVGPAEAKYERQTFIGRTSTLKEGEYLYGTITENQGLREGSVRSCYQSLTVQNIAAKLITESGRGFKYGDTNMNYNLQADDIITMEGTTEGMEEMISLVEGASKIAKVKQNTKKCGVVIISPRAEELKKDWADIQKDTKTLKIECKQQIEYLGTIITETMNTKTNVDMKIQAADTALIVLMTAGFTSWRLLPAEDRVLMIKMYIIPKVISGLNCFIINQDNEMNLIKFGNKIIRKCFHMGKNTPIAAMHLIAGTLPLNIYVRLSAVNLFLRTLATEDTPIRDLVIDIGTGKIDIKTSWTVYVMKILHIHGCKNPEKLLEEGAVTKANIKSLLRFYKRFIMRDAFEKLRIEAHHMPSARYLDLNKCKVGRMTKILKGMGTNLELQGGIYQAIMLTGGYITDIRREPNAVCEHCQKYPQTLEHYFTCNTLLEKYGWLWMEIYQWSTEPLPFIRNLANPYFRMQFILDPFSSALGEFALPKKFPHLDRLQQLMRHYIFNVHRERKEKRKILEAQGRDLPLKGTGDKVEELPKKVIEEQKKILENNRLQTILNTDFEVVRWDDVYRIHIPEKIKKKWRGILKAEKKRKKIELRKKKKEEGKTGKGEKIKRTEPNPL